MATICLLDDHELFTHSMRLALVAEGYEARRIDPFGDVAAGMRALKPDLVLLDLALGAGKRGVDLMSDIRPTCQRVLALTGETDVVIWGEAALAGCRGVLPKAAPMAEILAALEACLSDRPLPARFADPRWTAAAQTHRREQGRLMADFERLTEREGQVLAALMEGENVASIAAESVVSQATVRTQVRGVLTKLGVESQLQAVARATRAGWSPGGSARS